MGSGNACALLRDGAVIDLFGEKYLPLTDCNIKRLVRKCVHFCGSNPKKNIRRMTKVTQDTNEIAQKVLCALPSFKIS